MHFTSEADSPMGTPPDPQLLGSQPIGTEILLRATVVGRLGNSVALAVDHAPAPVYISAAAMVNG